jgi:hypothetical protein
MARATEHDPRIKQPKLITVGVFSNDEGGRGFRAYTRWYNPQWPGCCEHKVEAINGGEAKKLATQEHRDRCLPDPPEVK